MPAKTSHCTVLQHVEAESISNPSSKESCFFHLKDRPVTWLTFLGERGDCWWGKVVGSFLSVSSCARSWCSCGFPAKISPCTCWSSPWEERRSCSFVRSRWKRRSDFFNSDRCQCLLTRSKSYLHRPGPGTALRGERQWHERPRAAMCCLGRDALGAGVNMGQVLSSDVTQAKN